MDAPATEERYYHLRGNAEAFVERMRTMVAACERDGNDDLASKLKVWALMPWEAVIRDDDSGDLWPRCEVCGLPIKSGGGKISIDECDFHCGCVEVAGLDRIRFKPWKVTDRWLILNLGNC